MDYHEAADFLLGLRRFSVRPGTDSVAALLSELGDPHRDVPFVQIGGTNGKGSTARMVESILRESGLTVGLFTSPNFERLAEQITIDGRTVTKSAITSFVEQIEPYLRSRAAAGEPLTFFEVMTAMAIWQFSRRDVDVAILEVGLGGEYDATSVVDPIAACVTNVSLEHTNVLGETIEEIAETKAKIAENGVPLVTGADDRALPVIRNVAGELVTVGYADEQPDRAVTVAYGGRKNHTEASVTIEGRTIETDARVPLLGRHQAMNAGLAVALVELLADATFDQAGRDDPFDTPDVETVRHGLRNAHWPGRFEIVRQEPLVVLDGAHNPAAAGTLSETLSTFEYDALHLVFGAMHDKDHDGMIGALPAADRVYTCEPATDRAEDADVLADAFDRNSDGSTAANGIGVYDTVADALAAARQQAGETDCIVATGSLSVVAEARTTFTRRAVAKRVPSIDRARRVLEGADVPAETVEARHASAVHHTVRLRVDDRQATRLEAEFLRAGGDCAVSGIRRTGELKEVVVMGTTTQFEAATERLSGDGYGLASIAELLRRRAGLDPIEHDDRYPWDDGPAIMGVLNVTPDSFHDGGEYVDADDAIDRARTLVEAGADVVDVGGESTRPGAEPVPADAEIDRVVPVIEAISELDVAVSIDTRKATVAEAALDAGADIVNDVTGLEDPAMRFVAADREVPVIVMHSIDAPVIPDRAVEYDDVVEDVMEELTERVLLAEKAGIPRHRVIVDPGLGFGKRAEESFELLGRIDEFEALGCPVLVGHSHKSMFELIDRDPDDRLAATVAATALAADRGADIVRIHDVDENRAAVDVVAAAKGNDRNGPL